MTHNTIIVGLEKKVIHYHSLYIYITNNYRMFSVVNFNEKV